MFERFQRGSRRIKINFNDEVNVDDFRKASAKISRGKMGQKECNVVIRGVIHGAHELAYEEGREKIELADALECMLAAIGNPINFTRKHFHAIFRDYTSDKAKKLSGDVDLDSVVRHYGDELFIETFRCLEHTSFAYSSQHCLYLSYCRFCDKYNLWDPDEQKAFAFVFGAGIPSDSHNSIPNHPTIILWKMLFSVIREGYISKV